MERRNFIKNLGLSAGAVSIGTQSVFGQALPGLLSKSVAEAKDRVLILLYLNGGNDALNTFVPLDIYSELKEFRPDVIVPENQTLSLTDALGVHPSFSEIKSLFDDGKIGVVRDVGYSSPNMSHFSSREVIHTASDSSEKLTDGWLGRHMHSDLPDYPTGYPNAENPDPIILSMSSALNQITQSPVGNFNVSAGNPASKNKFDLDDLSTYSLDESRYGEELDFLRISAQQTNDFKEVIYNRYVAGTDMGTTENPISKQLKDIVRLLSAGSTTKVFIVSQGGYDTHGGQVEAGDPTSGKHSDNLKTLSEAIDTFNTDLEANNLADKVMGLCYTEFGRRITANESLGTDHGHAASWFVFGNKANPKVHGETTVLPTEINNKANVPHQFDFRDIYHSLLVEWFGVPEVESLTFFTNTPKLLSLIQPDATLSIHTHQLAVQIGIPTPNPVYEYTKIPFQLSEEQNVVLKIFNMEGRLLRTIPQGNLQVGRHALHFKRQGEAPGRVVFSIQTGNQQQSGTFLLR